jgi:hypothetical protein
MIKGRKELPMIPIFICPNKLGMKTSEIVHKMDKCFTKLRMPM